MTIISLGGYIIHILGCLSIGNTLQIRYVGNVVLPIDTGKKSCYTVYMVIKFTQQTVEKYKAMEQELNEFQIQRNAEIVRLYGDGNNGWTYQGLAEKFGLSRQRVSRIVKPRKKKT
jgi:hypothetical protein